VQFARGWFAYHLSPDYRLSHGALQLTERDTAIVRVSTQECGSEQ